MDRHICIHAHFYQPPRENPWLEDIEYQESAYPYHNWNQRITAECYAPNMVSRILDSEGRVKEMVNNYSRMSFNFGPTLLAWLEKHESNAYQAILDADKESQERFSGHGAALAQAYNHMIMPLANKRDKETQVLWGIRDFETRFHRKPEGMWLPETGVDLETLEVLAEQGIRFTILAPRQAESVRPIGDKEWKELNNSDIDPSRSYLARLPSGNKIALFFYDGPISQAVAFEKLLRSGETFAKRLLGGFSKDRTWPQLMHIATDGETYGHHHPFGDMALAYALDYIQQEKLAEITIYGEFLEKHPPTHEVKIRENSSWSCAHGIERWRSDCTCSSRHDKHWNQKWRAPLRQALDWLRDSVTSSWEEKCGTMVQDPWAVRNQFIEVILDRSHKSLEKFIKAHATHDLTRKEKRDLRMLLELQRHAMLMYTSCGWFFDELSGIETVQIIQYAARVLQLAEQVLGLSLTPEFLNLLEKAKSNIPAKGDGKRIYDLYVLPARTDLNKVAAHYAMTSLFEDHPLKTEIYCYQVEEEDFYLMEAGRAKLAYGRGAFLSKITGEAANISFGVIHLGDHNLCCGVRPFQGEAAYEESKAVVKNAFSRADFTDTIKQLTHHFGEPTYTLKSLFRNEQRRILDTIFATSLKTAEDSYLKLYNFNAPLMRFLKDSQMPLPKVFYMAAEFSINLKLKRALEQDDFDLEEIKQLLEEASVEEVSLDHPTLEFAARRSMERKAFIWRENPEAMAVLWSLEQMANLLDMAPFEMNIWTIQNIYYEVMEAVYPEMKDKADNRDSMAMDWVEHVLALGAKLSILAP